MHCFYTVTNVTGAPCPAWRGSAKKNGHGQRAMEHDCLLKALYLYIVETLARHVPMHFGRLGDRLSAFHHWTKMTIIIIIIIIIINPQTDGATERWNQEVLAVLRAFISYAQTNWPGLLPAVQLALHNSDNSRH